MKNLLIITQKVDTDDGALGFFCGWLNEFSKHFDGVYVIALSVGKYELPDNVFIYSLGREAGASKLLQIFRFYKYLLLTISKTRGVFAHMAPVFVIAVWPVAKLFNKKIFLWYTHKAVTPKLRIAEKLSDKIFTASKESFRMPSAKVIVTGHGINLELFKPEHKTRIAGANILSVGRISPIKNYETLIRAANILSDEGMSFSVTLAGSPVLREDKIYERKIRQEIKDLGLSSRFHFVGKIRNRDLPEYYQSHNTFVHLSKTGSLDKVLLEAMACGLTVLSSNDSARSFLPPEYTFRQNSAEELAERIRFALSYPKNFREYVEHNHDLKKLINKISDYYL